MYREKWRREEGKEETEERKGKERGRGNRKREGERGCSVNLVRVVTQHELARAANIASLLDTLLAATATMIREGKHATMMKEREAMVKERVAMLKERVAMLKERGDM